MNLKKLQQTPRRSILSVDMFGNPTQLLNLTDMKETPSTGTSLTNSSNCSSPILEILPETQLNKSQGHNDEGVSGNEMILSDDNTPNCHSERKAAAANSGYVSDSSHSQALDTLNQHLMSHPNSYIHHVNDLNSPLPHNTHSWPDQSSDPGHLLQDSGHSDSSSITTIMGGHEHGSHTSGYIQGSLKEFQTNGLTYSDNHDSLSLDEFIDTDGKGLTSDDCASSNISKVCSTREEGHVHTFYDGGYAQASLDHTAGTADSQTHELNQFELSPDTEQDAMLNLDHEFTCSSSSPHDSDYTCAPLLHLSESVLQIHEQSSGLDLLDDFDISPNVDKSILAVDDQLPSSEGKSDPLNKCEFLCNCERGYTKMTIPHSVKKLGPKLPQCDDLPPIDELEVLLNSEQYFTQDSSLEGLISTNMCEYIQSSEEILESKLPQCNDLPPVDKLDFPLNSEQHFTQDILSEDLKSANKCEYIQSSQTTVTQLGETVRPQNNNLSPLNEVKFTFDAEVLEDTSKFDYNLSCDLSSEKSSSFSDNEYVKHDSGCISSS